MSSDWLSPGPLLPMPSEAARAACMASLGLSEISAQLAQRCRDRQDAVRLIYRVAADSQQPRQDGAE